MRVLRPRLSSSPRSAALWLAAIAVTLAAVPAAQAPSVYTLVTKDARRTIPMRTSGSVDFLPLDQIAAIFNLTVTEDRLAGGITVTTRGQTITLSAGQPLASVGGRFVALAGPVTRQGSTWSVPADFLSRALGPALGSRIEVRKGPRMILVDLRMPQVASRIDRVTPTSGRLVVEFQPPTTHHVTHEGNHLVVRFDADQIDSAPLVGIVPDFITNARIDGPSLVFDLGPLAATVRTTDEADRVVVDLTSAPSAPAGGGRAASPQEGALDIASGALRVIVLDPGHGGDDEGVHGAGGTLEKDLTLMVAHRLKSALESRGGLRVMLTRDADENVPEDRRTALANNNKADLFISLHANASLKPDVRGAQVLSLNLDDYARRGQRAGSGGQRVPVAGGGSRIIDAVPWALAQIPFASRSASFATIVARRLADGNVSMFVRPLDVAPLGVLVGANMPAVLIEMGFLTNADDERALSSSDGSVVPSIVDAIAGAVGEVRNGIPEAPSSRPIK